MTDKFSSWWTWGNKEIRKNPPQPEPVEDPNVINFAEQRKKRRGDGDATAE